MHLGSGTGYNLPSAQSPVELLWALCEGLWLGHSSEGWHKGHLSQSIPWAALQGNGVAGKGAAGTRLSPSLLDQSPSNGHSAEMLPS